MAYTRRPASGSRTTVRLPGGITITAPAGRKPASGRSGSSTRRRAPARSSRW